MTLLRTAVETAIAGYTSCYATARGHRLNVSIVLAAVHGLLGLLCRCARSSHHSPPPPPTPTFSPSLINHLASVNVKQNVYLLNNPVNMPDPNHIRSGAVRNQWPEVGAMILAHRLSSGPDPFGQNLTQSARTKSDPGWFCTILSGMSAGERNRV